MESLRPPNPGSDGGQADAVMDVSSRVVDGRMPIKARTASCMRPCSAINSSNAITMSGSKCVSESRRRIPTASSCVIAERYGRSEVSAS